jgi:hypothetical protein
MIAMGVVDMYQVPILNMVVASHTMGDYTKKGMIAFFFFLSLFVLGLHASERISRDLHTVGHENDAIEGSIREWHLKKLLERMVMGCVELQCHLLIVTELLKRFQDGCLLFHENGACHAFLHGNRFVGFFHPVEMDLARIALVIVDGNFGAQFVRHGGADSFL